MTNKKTDKLTTRSAHHLCFMSDWSLLETKNFFWRRIRSRYEITCASSLVRCSDQCSSPSRNVSRLTRITTRSNHASQQKTRRDERFNKENRGINSGTREKILFRSLSLVIFLFFYICQNVTKKVIKPFYLKIVSIIRAITHKEYLSFLLLHSYWGKGNNEGLMSVICRLWRCDRIVIENRINWCPSECQESTGNRRNAHWCRSINQWDISVSLCLHLDFLRVYYSCYS